jgi:hypothetical protein
VDIKILLKNPLSRKILNSWGIKSPCRYRKNPSTGILERRFLSLEYDFLQCWKTGGFFSGIDIRGQVFGDPILRTSRTRASNNLETHS